MNTRQRKILKALVEEYIAEGEPISSGFLAKQYMGWGVSPATIRNELMELDEEGFLDQPHTSAGRVPTPKGYRFFVDNLLGEATIDKEERKMVEKFQNFIELSEFLAHQSRSLVLGGEDSEDVYEAGLLELLREPEFSDHEFLIDFISHAEKLRKEFDRLLDFVNSHPHLYIGEEGEKIVGNARYSVLITRVEKKGVAVFFGSTRMNYAKGLALANFLSEHYE